MKSVIAIASALSMAALALSLAPSAQAVTVCVPPTTDTNCVEATAPPYCVLSFYPDQAGSTGTYVVCHYPSGGPMGAGTTCAAAQYTPSTNYNVGFVCVNLLEHCVLGVALTASTASNFICVV